MNQSVKFRYKNIDLEYAGWPCLYKPGRFLPLRLSYNGTAGWWISPKIFLSAKQLKTILKNDYKTQAF